MSTVACPKCGHNLASSGVNSRVCPHCQSDLNQTSPVAVEQDQGLPTNTLDPSSFPMDTKSDKTTDTNSPIRTHPTPADMDASAAAAASAEAQRTMKLDKTMIGTTPETPESNYPPPPPRGNGPETIVASAPGMPTPPESGFPPADHYSPTIEAPVDKTMVRDDVPASTTPTPQEINQPPSLGPGGATTQSDVSPIDPGSDSAQVKQIWEGLADSKMGPMASIKSEEMSLGREEGLVIHKRSMAHRDAAHSAECDYQLVSFLGEGGMGTVYEANQTSVQRNVAVKTLRPELARKNSDRQKFLYEARITGDLDHPNIVPIHDLGVNTDGTLFYSMKRVEGTPWQDVIHTKSRADNLDILMKVADAISFAHARDVIHRDLKPENVMLGQFGEVLVMDWGLAVNLAKGKNFVLGGTPAYMAPEMARHQVNLIDKCSDIYLLGAMLFQIVSGIPPHPGETVTQCVSAAARNQIIAVDIQDELLNIALKAMDSDVRNRHRTVNEFQQAIRDYEAHAESIAITTRAEQELEKGINEDDYEAFSRALFGFQDALELWPTNQRAEDRLSETKLAYAEKALAKEDFDLGLSILDPSVPAEASIFRKLDRGAKERVSRQKRMRTMRRTVFVALLLGVIASAGGGGLAVYGWKEQKDANEGIKLANAQLTKEKETVARQNKTLVEQGKELERNYTELETTQKGLEESNKQLEQRRKDLEQANKDLETEKKLVEESRQELQMTNDSLTEAKGELEVANKDLENQRERLTILNEQLDASELTAQFGRFLAEITLANDNVRNGNIGNAIKRLDEIRMDEKFPLSFKGWELHRIYHLSHSNTPSKDLGGNVAAIAASGDGSVLAAVAGGGIIRLYNGQTGDALGEIELPDSFNDRVFSIALTEDGSQLAVATGGASDNNLSIWNVADKSLIQSMRGHEVRTHAVKFSDNGLIMVSGGAERGEPFKQMRLWERASVEGKFEEVTGYASNYPVYSVDLSGDGNRVVMTMEMDRFMVWSRDREKDPTKDGYGKLLAQCFHDNELPDRPTYIHSAIFDPTDPTGNRILSGTSDELILAWDLSDLPASNRWVKLESDAALRIEGHTGAVRTISAVVDRETRLSDESLVPKVVSGSEDGTLIVWDPVNLVPVKRLPGHDERVTVSAFSSDGEYVFSGSEDDTIRFWHLPSIIDELELTSLPGGSQGLPADIVDIDFNHDSSLLVAGDQYGRMNIWDGDSANRLTATTMGHGPGQELMTYYDPDTKKLVTSSTNGTTLIWNTETKALVKQLKHPPNSVPFDISPDGRTLATYAGQIGDLHRIVLTDLETREDTLYELADGQDDLRSILFAPDGQSIVAGSSNFLWRWRLESGEVEWRFGRTCKSPADRMYRLPNSDSFLVGDAAENSVRVYPFRPQGDDKSPVSIQLGLAGAEIGEVRRVGDRTLVVAYAKNEDIDDEDRDPNTRFVAVFDASDWHQIGTPGSWESSDPIVRSKVLGDIGSAAISTDGATAYATKVEDGAIQIDVETGQINNFSLIEDLQGRIPSGYQDQALSVAKINVAASGDYVLSGPGHAWIWTPGAAVEAFRILPEPSCLTSRFHPTEQRIVSVHNDGIARVWEVSEVDGTPDLRVLHRKEGDYQSAIYSPDGSQILAIGRSGSLNLLSATLEELASFEIPEGTQVSVANFSASGKLVAAGTIDGQSLLWRTVDGGIEKIDVQLPNNSAEITAVCIGPDDSTVISAGYSGDVNISVTSDDWTSHELLTTIQLGGTCADARLNPDGDRLLLANGRLLQLWHLDRENAELIESVYELSHRNPVRVARFSRDGQTIASAARDEGGCILWLTDAWNLEKRSRPAAPETAMLPREAGEPQLVE